MHLVEHEQCSVWIKLNQLLVYSLWRIYDYYSGHLYNASVTVKARMQKRQKSSIVGVKKSYYVRGEVITMG